ncbi:hypothetical protein, partial [Escherichia albertii]|uniref:hypothetical protein n=1 Tax=Escherichia albertii TaxID=208962 RepID=UPI001BAFEED2
GVTPYPTYKTLHINELINHAGLIRRASAASGIMCKCRMRRDALSDQQNLIYQRVNKPCRPDKTHQRRIRHRVQMPDAA